MSLLRRWWFWLSPWMSFGMLLLFLRGHLPIPHCALKHPSDDKKVISKGGKGTFWGLRSQGTKHYSILCFLPTFFSASSQRIEENQLAFDPFLELQNSWKNAQTTKYSTILCYYSVSQKVLNIKKILNQIRQFELYFRKISLNIQKCFLTLENSLRFFPTVSNLWYKNSWKETEIIFKG